MNETKARPVQGEAKPIERERKPTPITDVQSGSGWSQFEAWAGMGWFSGDRWYSKENKPLTPPKVDGVDNNGGRSLPDSRTNRKLA